MSSNHLSAQEIITDTKLVRIRYEMPDSSAFVRYLPAFDESAPESLTVQSYWGRQPVSMMKTGTFTLPELVNELNYAYVLVHVFQNENDLTYFLAGFDTSLSQLEFIGGNYDFNNMWITSGSTALGIPMAIFLGQRNAVNGQPSVTLVDHREQPNGVVAYRAVKGAGDHVGEEYYSA